MLETKNTVTEMKMLLMSLSADWTQLRKQSKFKDMLIENFKREKRRETKTGKKKKQNRIDKSCETTIKGGGVCMLSRVWLFATLWTVACQAPLFMGLSRQEYWSGLPFLTP